jgi:hypothetical protein
MNHLRRSRNNRRRNVSRKSQRGGVNCPDGQYVYENSCVSQCPKGTYEEEDYLPLTCTHDNWYNKGLSATRVTANKVARATSNAARATSDAAHALASASREAAVNAARATSSWANLKLDEAASIMYNSCKQYISNYESALATGKDVTTIPPLSQTLLDSNMDQVVSSPMGDSFNETSLPEPTVSPSIVSLPEPSVSPSVVSLPEPSVVSLPEPSFDLSFKDPNSRVTFSSPTTNSMNQILKFSYSKILNMLTKAGYMNIVNELKAANSSEEVQNIINNAKIDGRSITFYKNSIQTGGKRKRIMISRRRQLH